ncbi:proteasome subunit beta [Candidatus Woesearchaeota archaeon]|nr:proteasome subunit beta [Candidatus Woesearchaeota archaeon]
MSENSLKTGTTTLGIKCSEGIILAADKRATAGNFIASKEAEKIIPINDKMAVTTAGTVSDVQMLVKGLRGELKLKSLKSGRMLTTKEAANLLAGMVYYNIRKMSMIPGISHFLFAGNDKYENHLYEIYPDGSMNEVKDFVASGSGSPMVYGLLESEYKENMSKTEAKDMALKAINSALKRDSASGNGIDMVLINKDGIQRLVENKKPDNN